MPHQLVEQSKGAFDLRDLGQLALLSEEISRRVSEARRKLTYLEESEEEILGMKMRLGETYGN